MKVFSGLYNRKRDECLKALFGCRVFSEQLEKYHDF